MSKHDFSQMDSSPEGLRKYIAWLRDAYKAFPMVSIAKELDKAKRRLNTEKQFAEYLYCAPCIVGGRFTNTLTIK